MFYEFSKNIKECFRGYNLLWHFSAIALTYIFVTSGFDWFYYLGTRNQILSLILFPAVILGGLLPIFGPIFLLIIGKVRKDLGTVNTAWGVAQAGFIGWLISSFYKAWTGRVHPEFVNVATDISGKFRFGLWRGGIFWGWPSSHTTVAFAVAVALWILYQENKKIKYFALLYAFYVGIGVSMTIHWFSEFAAGAIIGTLIGKIVGRSFRDRYSGPN